MESAGSDLKGYVPIHKSWHALRRSRHQLIALPLTLNLLILGLIIALRLSGWVGSTALPWQRWTSLTVAAVALVLMIAISFKTARRPAHERLAGRCFACGEPRTMFVDRCFACGDDFGLQDWYANTPRGRARGRSLSAAYSTREFVALVLQLLLNAPLIIAFAVSRDDLPVWIAGFNGKLWLIVVLGIAGMVVWNLVIVVVLRPFRRMLLSRLSGCCFNCAHPADSRLMFCTHCGQSLRSQRASCCLYPQLTFLLNEKQEKHG